MLGHGRGGVGEFFAPQHLRSDPLYQRLPRFKLLLGAVARQVINRHAVARALRIDNAIGHKHHDGQSAALKKTVQLLRHPRATVGATADQPDGDLAGLHVAVHVQFDQKFRGRFNVKDRRINRHQYKIGARQQIRPIRPTQARMGVDDHPLRRKSAQLFHVGVFIPRHDFGQRSGASCEPIGGRLLLVEIHDDHLLAGRCQHARDVGAQGGFTGSALRIGDEYCVHKWSLRCRDGPDYGAILPDFALTKPCNQCSTGGQSAQASSALERG